MPALVVVSVVLLAVRLWAASRVGFGDSEALYASWALHPQPAYLDHPGLIGVVARAIGSGAAPLPLRTHVLTSFAATAVPLLLAAVARASGASVRRAAYAGLVVALVPEIAVGLFALTPDLLLAPLWVGSLGLAILGLGAPARPGDARREGALLGAGLLAGIAAAAKVSGLLLMAALAVAYLHCARDRAGSDARRAARSLWPWAGLVAGLVVLVPIAGYEARLGFPMLRHRLVDTQQGAGPSLRNLGALVGGQAVYLSPVVAFVAALVGRDLVRRRNDDAASRVLFWSFALPLAPLALLCAWSPVAEPHWLAPPLLALPIHAARRAPGALPFLRRRVVTIAAGVAALMTAGAHAWALVPTAARLVPADTDRRADVARELYGWPSAIEAVRDQMKLAATPSDPEGREVVVVGPHWTVCAQLHAALAGVRVGCATPVPDDFDRWLPRSEWRRAETVLFVTDDRFEGDGSTELPALVRVAESRVRVLRGGRTARVFTLYLYSRRERADVVPDDASYSASAAARGGIAFSPASRMRARSSSSVAFGVVRSLSP